MSEKICLHAVVTGKVQGVWFRVGTRQEALRLGLRGWVRNLGTGEVEVLAVGPREAVKALEQWLHQGPPAAEVQKVKTEEVAEPLLEDADFKVI